MAQQGFLCTTAIHCSLSLGCSGSQERAGKGDEGLAPHFWCQGVVGEGRVVCAGESRPPWQLAGGFCLPAGEVHHLPCPPIAACLSRPPPLLLPWPPGPPVTPQPHPRVPGTLLLKVLGKNKVEPPGELPQG